MTRKWIVSMFAGRVLLRYGKVGFNWLRNYKVKTYQMSLHSKGPGQVRLGLRHTLNPKPVT